MKIEQKKWTPESGWEVVSEGSFTESPELVLVFGGSVPLKDKDRFDERWVAISLELAVIESERLNWQYICTINSDDIPTGEFSSEFADKFNKSVRITLTDKEES